MAINDDKKKKKKKRKVQRKVREHRLILRNTRLGDYPEIKAIMDAVYSDLGGAWTQEQFAAQITRFPDGQIAIEDNGKVIAAAISLIVDYDRFGDQHTYKEITGNGYITSHDPNGDTLYGVDIFVHPDYRDLRLGRRLYDARKSLCEHLNLRRIVAGGRIPGYAKQADRLSPSEYIDLVKRKELRDPILSFQLANDFHVRRLITGYLPEDGDSGAYATLIEWNNIHYHEPQREENLQPVSRSIRVGAVQWQMRPAASLEEFTSQVEFFVDAVSGYGADFLLFPEFFTAPLLFRHQEANPATAIRELAAYSEPLRETLLQYALSYNINIIAGSTPVYEDQSLYNVSYLLRRDGTWDAQYKLHITPDENAYWGLSGGQRLRVFDTDVARIGILICYDVEFPELPRILAEQGIDILFIPYWTDTKNAYQRVRLCAQARAIENEIYVVATGSVGNLPNVDNMDIQYSQSAIFTPSDFAFPHDAVAAEATPNTEMSLIADLDLTKLTELRQQGSVRNARDRRRDLYRVQWLNDLPDPDAGPE
jgi:predicted amidohydrolase/GNAT superfamily N-acetyltransferase